MESNLMMNKTRSKLEQKSIVSERWRAICFSRISATENEIELFIKQEVLKDNYGKNYKNYMYAELNEKNFAELLISASKLLSRIGVAIIKVHYFDRAGIEKKDVGGLVFSATCRYSWFLFKSWWCN
jgi:hypothetical protein